jgi:hypothetical protein
LILFADRHGFRVSELVALVGLGRARRLDGAFATTQRTQKRHPPTKPIKLIGAIQNKITDLPQKLAVSSVTSPVAGS